MTDNHGIDRALVDFDVLKRWMDGEGLPTGAISSVEMLAGGTQNHLIKFERGGRWFVLRRGPQHLRPRTNDVLRREMRMLSALAGSDVPHPGFIAGCPDEAVMGGAVFYLMEPVDGFNPSTGLPPLHAGSAEVRHEMGIQAAEAIARLGAVDYVAAGLEDFGQPDGFIDRQVGRWLSELEGYSKNEGYPGPEIPGIDEVAAWLDANKPKHWIPGILHGDYHFSNVMFAHDSGELVAIVDWEMCTIGDPLLDLGWLLATWPEPGKPMGAGSAIAAAGGMCSPDEALAHYAAHTSRDLSAIAWYKVLACFKLGIVLEGTHARAWAGKAPKVTGDLLHGTTLRLFDQARQLIRTE